MACSERCGDYINWKRGTYKEGIPIHFVTGGAYNGKNRWVMEHEREQLTWYNGYEVETIEPAQSPTGAICIYGLDLFIRNFLKDEQPKQSFELWLQSWLDWEKKKGNKLYLIGTDVGKGIVPMDPELRRLRDMIGTCYQVIAAKADRVDLIWYGLNERLK